VETLERAGCEVAFPLEQGCCGQPAFNVGLVESARVMAGQTLDVLDRTEGPVVVPSGSCAAMMTHHYQTLLAGTDREQQAVRVGGRVRELTQFLVVDLDTGLTASCEGCAIAFHHSCHGLRDLGLEDQADRLLEGTRRVELEGDRECCGFGGLFSIEMPAVSTAIMDAKLDRVMASGADTLVAGDISCLMHMAGGLRRRGSNVEVRHIAQLLGEK
jgi:L-lactate dehydrogenase complex protein LldE